MRSEIVGYSSVRGLMHIKSRLPNQDSYLIRKFKFGTLIVVSDGMGSHIHADIGSKSVCRSVSRAFQLWWEYECDDIRLLIPVLHSIWSMDIYPNAKNECGATCLFAFIGAKGQVYLGQLGDGSIFYDIGEGIKILKDKDDDFSNLTLGMNNPRSFEDWTLQSLYEGEKPIKICMMTDGVSETLIVDRRKDFVKLLWKKMFEINSVAERNNMIYQILSGWNPVNSGDDRTLVSYEKR